MKWTLNILQEMKINMKAFYFQITAFEVFFKEYQNSILLTESEFSLLSYISASTDFRLGCNTKSLNLIYKSVPIIHVPKYFLRNSRWWNLPLNKNYNLWRRFKGWGGGGDKGGFDTRDEDNYIYISKIIYWGNKLTKEYQCFSFILVNIYKIT